jgi:bifunctional DNase/RNase
MKEMQIDSIRVSLMNYQHVVILKERQTDRYLPIWIGPAEADAISMKLQNVDVSRPMTTFKNTFSALESISVLIFHALLSRSAFRHFLCPDSI